MSGLRFVLVMAWREGRAAWRRLSLLVAAVAVGVAALVAINSFTDNLRDSVRGQARLLLGGDLFAWSAGPFSARAEEALGRLAASVPGASVARVSRFAAMAYVPHGSGSRLVGVVGIDGDYPFYGRLTTDPPGAWERLASGGGALVDPALLAVLDARVGDTLSLGEARLAIRGTVADFPGDVAVRSALGPRVYLGAGAVAATRLLGFGSRARHEIYLRLPDGADAMRLVERHRPALAAERVGLRSASEAQELTGDALGRLGRYLGLVALVALLLGGIGVASAIHVFVKRRVETVAILRCLGASGRQVLAVYLAQALAIALVGSAAGAAVGTGLQLLLPRVVGEFLPVAVPLAPSWRAAGVGLGLGLWAAALFSLLPLLPIRRVSPLVVLRRPYQDDGQGERDPARILAALALAGSVVGLAAAETGSLRTGLAFAGGIGVAAGTLWLAAFALTRGVRRLLPSSWPYVWRQGVANLFRPGNQTLAVVLALGFGAFLLETILLVQHNLLRELRPGGGSGRPNVVFFDIQPDQREGVEAELRAASVTPAPAVPIVPMRIASVKGVPAQSLLSASATLEPKPGSPNPGTLRREYRSTYRDHVTPSETVVAGAIWSEGSWRLRTAGEATIPISLEADVARELGVGVGDGIVWDVQGLSVATRVESLREVRWARFEPNFFVVFPEGPLDDAPRSYLTLARLEGTAARARLARRIAERFPNVTALDLSQVQQVVEGLLSRASLAIRFMALFSLAAGAVVLAGAVATSRFQRVRESVLLRALGATRGQILRILLAEYLSLGALASATATLLAAAAAWALLRFVFEAPFYLPVAPLAALAAGVLVLAVGVGLGGSTEVLRKPPLEVLRAE